LVRVASLSSGAAQSTLPVQLRAARSIFSNAMNFCCRPRFARRDDIARGAAQFSMWLDVTLFPFLGGHRLVRDGVNDIGLLRVVEHPQVLAQGHQSRQLVVLVGFVARQRVGLGDGPIRSGPGGTRAKWGSYTVRVPRCAENRSRASPPAARAPRAATRPRCRAT
jgi:hypothetical protein